jgi:hypothetical protein
VGGVHTFPSSGSFHPRRDGSAHAHSGPQFNLQLVLIFFLYFRSTSAYSRPRRQPERSRPRPPRGAVYLRDRAAANLRARAAHFLLPMLTRLAARSPSGALLFASRNPVLARS